MKLVYLVHDLADAAVHRRVRMLLDGGTTPVVIGFRRGDKMVADIHGITPIEIGQTRDAKLVQRIGSVLHALIRSGRLAQIMRGTDVIMARQLEMLVLAAWLRRRTAPNAALVYECLDIHRLMAGGGKAGHMLRRLERALLARCALLVVSSQAFVERYFKPVQHLATPVRLVENRVLESELPETTAHPMTAPIGSCWRIGWFGVIRCARSLTLLADLVRANPGRIEVVIRGRPAHSAVPDFDRIVAETPGLSFLGPYDRARDLPMIYGDVHFTWAIDFYEAGANSDWLLPNRLYEGGIYGTVPIVRAGTETANWLAAHGAGISLAEPLDQSLPAWFAQLTADGYAAACAASRAIPHSAFVESAEDCRGFVQTLSTLPSGALAT